MGQGTFTGTFSMSTDFRDRKEATGKTWDEIIVLGIETAEKQKKVQSEKTE